MRALELASERLQLAERLAVILARPRRAEATLDLGRSRSGRCSSTLRSLCLTQRCTGVRAPSTAFTAALNALEPSITTSTPCSTSRPRATRSESSAVATLLGRALPRPNQDLHAVGRDPERDNVVRPFSSIPSSISTARRTSDSVRLINFFNVCAVRCTNVREIELLDVERAFA